jgi:hypothetical protein
MDTKTQDWEKGLEKLMEYTEKQGEIIKANFNYKEFYFKEDESRLVGGKLICKHCGEEFKWKEWGRGQTISVGRASKHLKEHNIESFNHSLVRGAIDITKIFPEGAI